VTTPETGPLSQAVIGLADQAARSRDRSLAEAGRAAQVRLRRPLSVAAVGRVSAGKSTLINALLETRISPTAGGECTTVVYVFRKGQWTTARLTMRDGGAPVPLRFEGSRLPARMDVPPADIRSVDVTLTAALLERVTLIDTPGLASTNEENSAVTERLLSDSSDAAAEADALLFCVNGPLKDDEAETVREFRSGRGASRLTAATAVGILTKADQISNDRRSAWKQSVELAGTMSKQHVDLFSSVVPVVGLLAETAATGALREPHARALGALAREWNPDRTEDALRHVKLFLKQEGPVPTEVRQQLVDLLGLFGIGELLDALRAGCPVYAGALTKIARAASGLDDMTSRLRTALGRRADVLKAAGALERLLECARDARDRGLQAEAQQMLDLPEMFELRVLELAQQLAKGQVRPPKGLVEQAWITVQTGLPAATPAQAARAAAEWRDWAALADGEGRRLARVMVRAWQLAVR
jgi:hypothetical protein